MRTFSKLLLMGLVTSAVTSAPAIVDANPDPDGEAGAPDEVPADAVLDEGPDRAEVDGLRLRVREGTGGYELVIENASAVAHAVAWKVVCAEVSGSLMSRMGPRETEIGQKPIERSIAAGERVVVPLGVAVIAHDPAPASPPGELARASFHGVRFRIEHEVGARVPETLALLALSLESRS